MPHGIIRLIAPIQTMKTITFEQLQKEQAEWARHNFPNALPHQPLLGMGEEVGELNTPNITIEAEKDAVGDILIYAADYCTRNGLSMTALQPEYNERALFLLFHFHLKHEQGIRYSADVAHASKQKAVSAFLAHILFIAQQFGFDAMEAVTVTWEKVKQRDWKAKPMDAAKGELNCSLRCNHSVG